MTSNFDRVRAAAIDGRLHNIYHRQVQLERLCAALISNISNIQEAIATDYGHTPAEIAVEYHLAISAVKKCYAELKPKEAHQQEYLIANGTDAPENRVPAGIVYIEPTSHAMLYSVVVPLASALAAGNCVILLLENNLRAVPSLLRKLLTSALDADVFAVAASPVKDVLILDHAICVLQNGVEQVPRQNQLTHRSSRSVVAVVDRTADLRLAAHDLVAARFSFGGRSPYAPDCVLVNEFAKKDFLEAVASECASLSTSVEGNMRKTTSRSRVGEQLETLRKAHSSLGVVLQDLDFAVVDTADRDSLLSQRTDASIMVIHSIKSLDDAIDLVGSSTEDSCLAAYHFGNPATGQYLAQFIASETAYINHIPRELLVGPVVPSGLGLIATERDPTKLFSLRRPAFITPATGSKALADVLGGQSPRLLLEDATTPLAEFKRHPAGGVGFFEQGFLINAGIIVSIFLTVSVAGSVWSWRHCRAM
ncbi:4,4'-diaponeurosporen-aldehyde dehydrogenase [Fulvia fulva]|uniref:4,4'-diaponeurosporen-aldehyde dehydrogenase n=1 Tax=Passalora fulva TaxID=5499 RepID=A0A9Q8PJE1_PASFU|nr:4,4'-diaponeurosporen-aldehyde dehydrogenase [Fulvia fulva]KAK4612274.1 4,4'-diaponeurosporen-aldehyde dehydrogenase [Fulvia fulva]UJO23492.1 4,4'-diaponeurosporen-aldehyde dehydrogenase [Fulvia fulva]WPV21183.1 4,4'-diaponeurosporen-aldehyde dehydrogenase [Fulvia fulva]WPV36544.1 4,4'-diaponeurosporen-aldehyde dehydrogenase [Fulvia fulva]